MEAESKSHFDLVGSLALGSRLRRLSDYYLSEVKKVYKARNLDFDPTWFPLFTFLRNAGKSGIMEAAENLGITHPHVIQLARQLEKKGYIQSVASKTDARSRELMLTPKGRKVADKLDPVWKLIKNSIEFSIPELGFDMVDILKKMETYYSKASLSERVDQLGKTGSMQGVKIEKYKDKYIEDFERLNRQWLEKYFSVEPPDKDLFKNLRKKVVDEGGEIIFAVHEGKVVGTCGLIKEGDRYQVARMVVDEEFRGRRVGDLLLKEILAIAEAKNPASVYLFTNSRLRPAINLYKKYGFEITFEGPHPVYKRADTIMEKFYK